MTESSIFRVEFIYYLEEDAHDRKKGYIA